MDDPDEFLVQGRCGNGNFSALAAGLEGSVRKATYLGSHMEYWVDCAIGELFVICGRGDDDIRLARLGAVGSAPDGDQFTVIIGHFHIDHPDGSSRLDDGGLGGQRRRRRPQVIDRQIDGRH